MHALAQNPNRILIPAVLAGFALGIGVGVMVAGRQSPDAASPAASAALPTQAPNAAEVSGTSATQSPASAEAKQDQSPITAAQLRSEIAEMMGGGLGGFDGMRKLVALGDRVRGSDPAALARDFAAAPQQPGSESAWGMIMQAYSEKDPTAAWAFAQSMKPGTARQVAMMSVISAMSATDPAAAVRLAESTGDRQLERQARYTAIHSLARKDPRAALQLSASLGQTSERGLSDMQIIFGTWARQDPEAAMAAAEQMEGPTRDMARRGLVSTLVQTDPEAAWRYAQNLPASAESYADPRMDVIQRWADTDPQAALKAALSISDAQTRPMAISRAVASWSSRDFPAALDYAVGLQDTTLRSEILYAMSMNGGADSQKLLNALIEHMPVGDNFRNAVSNLLGNWARENPAEAAAAVTQLPAGRALSSAVSRVASQWAETGPPSQVLAWAQSLPAGEARANALEAVFSQMSSRDPQQAMAALAMLPAADRKDAINSFAQGWSRSNPQAVLQWAGTLADPGERSDVIRSAVAQWAGTAPEAAAAWVERLPADQNASAMQAVADRWASKDAEAAAAWVARQPAGQAKDSAISSLTRQIASEDPEAALQWAGTIADAKTRERQTEQLARDWMRQDPGAARKWIEKSSLPPDTRNRLLKSGG